MGDNGITSPPAKKRVASQQISKYDGSGSDDETLTPDFGSFQKAPEDILASRRIVKVRQNSAPASSGPNAFASIRLVPPPSTAVDVNPAPASAPSVVIAAEAIIEAEVGKDSEKIEQTDASLGESVNAEKLGMQMGEKDPVESADLAASDVKEPEETAGAEDGGEDKHIDDGGDVQDEGKDSQPVLVSAKGKGSRDEDGGSNQGNSISSTVKPEHIGVTKDQGMDNHPEQCATGLASTAVSTNSFSKISLPSSGTAFSSATFSFGTAPLTFETPTGFASFRTSSAFGSGIGASGTSSGPAFAFKAAGEGGFSMASSSLGNNNGTGFQLFSSQASTSSSTLVSSSSGSVQLQEITVHTGEEQEKAVFVAEATLFEFAGSAWKERGKGELKVNVSEDTSARPRLLMRMKGNYKLLLNASLFPDMKMASMDSRGVTFACVNSAAEGKDGLTTYALKFKDSLAATSFREAVNVHKGDPNVGLKTPENSPRARHESERDFNTSEP